MTEMEAICRGECGKALGSKLISQVSQDFDNCMDFKKFAEADSVASQKSEAAITWKPEICLEDQIREFLLFCFDSTSL